MSRSRSPRARQASDPFRIYVGGVDDGRERGDIIDISVTTGDKMAAVEKRHVLPFSKSWRDTIKMRKWMYQL